MARQQDIQKLDAENGQTVGNLPLLLVCVKAEEFRFVENDQQQPKDALGLFGL